MPKFKIGDRVRVQPYSYRDEITGTIINVRGQYCLYDVALDKPFLESMKTYLAAPGELAPAKEDKAKIVFYVDPKEHAVHCKFLVLWVWWLIPRLYAALMMILIF